jgi:hypothetical protein
LPTSVAEGLLSVGRNDRRLDHTVLTFATVPGAGTTFNRSSRGEKGSTHQAFQWPIGSMAVPLFTCISAAYSADDIEDRGSQKFASFKGQ